MGIFRGSGNPTDGEERLRTRENEKRGRISGRQGFGQKERESFRGGPSPHHGGKEETII